jgi:hypothetical protein
MYRFLLLACALTMVITTVRGYICACGCCNPAATSGCVFNSNISACSTTCGAMCQSGCPTACSASTGAVYCTNSLNGQSTANSLCAAVSTSTNSTSASRVISMSKTYSVLPFLSATFVYIFFG